MVLIIGIDPGSIITGYGLIKFNKNYNTFNYINSGIIKTPKNVKMLERLKFISLKIKKITQQYKPNIIAIEKMFVAKNFNTAITLGQTSGFILSSMINIINIPIYEYSVLEIKRIVNTINIKKKIILPSYIENLLNINFNLDIDASDALSVAICHIHLIKKKQKLLFKYILYIQTLIIKNKNIL